MCVTDDHPSTKVDSGTIPSTVLHVHHLFDPLSYTDAGLQRTTCIFQLSSYTSSRTTVYVLVLLVVWVVKKKMVCG
jgi:hypothetical protein